MKVATHLSKHPKIEWVRYPGLSRDPMHRLQKTYLKGKGGPLVVIGLKGGRAAGEKMINSLKLFSHVANVGDAKSLAIHPASTTHSQLSDEEQRFVRERMYPWDSRTHARACSRSSTSVARVVGSS